MMRRPFSKLRLVLIVSAVLTSAPLARDVAAQSTVLPVGRAVRAMLAEGDTARYTVELADESFLFGEVNQFSVNVLVRLLDPDGNQRGRFDVSARGGERFSRQTTDGGVYIIEVISSDDGAGDYEITLHRAEPLETDPRRLTDQLMSRYDGDDSPGAAMQAWRDGRTLYSKAYGMANLAYGIPFETDTRTNIGSTAKQFTALAIMLQADRGLLSLDDDIREHVSEVPEFEETITVRHIITHTSGLREFANLLLMTDRQLLRGDWIDRSEVIEIVQRQPALQNVPGAEWNYNNTAFSLAATIVERTSGQDFDVFLRENVFEPLGMNNTMVRRSPEQIVSNYSQGYAPGADGFRQVPDLGGSTGAGGIYTTVGDLQTWVENYATPRVGSAKIFEEMMTSYVLHDGEETGYGYGLDIDEQRGLRRVHHGGGDLAHRSQLVYYPEINAGITVQSNNGGFNTNLAFQLAAAFFGDAMEPEEEEGAKDAEEVFDPENYDPEDFDAYVGRYALDAAPNIILTFTREAETLYVQITGQEPVEIVPTSDSTFTLTVVDGSVVFRRNEEGEVDGATILQNGENHATRLEDGVAAWEPSADDLVDFEGRYFSEELESFYTIVLEDEGLVVRRRRHDDARLTVSEEDTFTGGGLSYSFERDRNGQVIGFYLANGRTRDVRFEPVR